MLSAGGRCILVYLLGWVHEIEPGVSVKAVIYNTLLLTRPGPWCPVKHPFFGAFFCRSLIPHW